MKGLGFGFGHLGMHGKVPKRCFSGGGVHVFRSDTNPPTYSGVIVLIRTEFLEKSSLFCFITICLVRWSVKEIQ